MVEALVVRSCVVVVVDACVAGGTYNLAAVREVVGNLADASAAGVHYNAAGLLMVHVLMVEGVTGV